MTDTETPSPPKNKIEQARDKLTRLSGEIETAREHDQAVRHRHAGTPIARRKRKTLILSVVLGVLIAGVAVKLYRDYRYYHPTPEIRAGDAEGLGGGPILPPNLRDRMPDQMAPSEALGPSDWA